MKKKWIAIVVAIATLTTTTSALAAQPSKTTEDLTRVVTIETKTGTTANALIWVEKQAPDLAKTQLETIKSYIAKKNSIANYFPDDAKKSMTAMLPTGTDLTKLKLSEYIPIGIGDYDAKLGDVSATFQFPTSFGTDKTVVVMVGYAGSDGTVIWQALKTTVVKGNLLIVFPSELMTKIGHDAILAVLSY